MKIALFFLIFVLTVFFIAENTVEVKANSTSWLEGWAYRKSHVINAASGSGTNYSIPIKVYKKPYIYDANITNAFFFSLQRPRSVYYSGTYNRTYFVYSDEDGLDKAYANYFDHDTRTFGTPVIIGSYFSEYHGSPTILVDSAGKLHVFFTGHNGNFVNYTRTNNPEDISSWTTSVDLCPETFVTFSPAVILSNNHMFIVYRVSTVVVNQARLIKSTNGGIDWSSPQTIADGADAYSIYSLIVKANNSDRIHYFGFFYGFSDNKVKFIVYAYTDDEGDTWKRVDGSTITLPMSASTMTAANYGRAVDTPDHNLDGGAYGMDDDNLGKPFILYKKVVASGNQPFLVARWTGSAWTLDSIISGVYTYIGDIKVVSSSEAYAFIDVSYALKKYRWNGSNWAFVENIEIGSTPNGSSSPHFTEQTTNLESLYQWGAVSTFDTNIHLYVDGLPSVSDGTETYFGLTVGRVVANEVSDDFADIRFTSSDGTTVLPYWLDHRDNGTSAIFWVNILADLSTQNRTIYIYWGKSDATYIGNEDNVFLFGDDFEDANLNTWTTSTTWTAQSTTVKEGLFAAKANLADQLLRKTHSIYQDKVTEMWMRTPVTNTVFFAYDMRSDAGTPQSSNIYFRETGYFAYYTTTYNNIALYTANTWYRVRFIMLPTNYTIRIYTTTGSLFASVIAVSYRSYDSNGLFFFPDNALGLVDNLFMRKIVSPEPSHGAWGNQETPPTPPTITLTITSDPIGVRFTLNETSQTTPYITSLITGYELSVEQRVIVDSKLYVFQYWTIDDVDYSPTLSFYFAGTENQTITIYFRGYRKPAPLPPTIEIPEEKPPAYPPPNALIVGGFILVVLILYIAKKNFSH